jgi:hypothetical protein
VLSVRESRVNYDLSRKKFVYKFTPNEAEFQSNMEVQRGQRDKTGHMAREAPSKGSFEEKRKKELENMREKYNVNFLGYYRGGLPQKGKGRHRGNNKSESLGSPGMFHPPAIHNWQDNYNPEATFVTSEDAVKFKQWMRTDQVDFEMSRPHYKTYYDYNFEWFQDRSFYLGFLMLSLLGCYASNKWYVESCRWHTHQRRTQLQDMPAHHFNNRGGVLMEKEFKGFTRYFKNGEDQLAWYKMAYPAIYGKEGK